MRKLDAPLGVTGGLTVRARNLVALLWIGNVIGVWLLCGLLVGIPFAMFLLSL